MRLADPGRAIQQVKEFQAALAISKAAWDALDFGWDASLREEYEQAKTKVLRLQPLIEEIAHAAGFRGRSSPFIRQTHSGLQIRDSALDEAERLLGTLQRLEERKAILGPRGPALAADGLHKWVWKAAVNLWDDGHYREAVQSAAAAVEEQTQLKMERTDLSGADLFTQAFSTEPSETGKPRLRFPYIKEEAKNGMKAREWTSAHEGAMFFGRGSFLGIRNLQAHGTSKLSEQEALEFLAALSVLARWVDKAEVVEAPEGTPA